MKKRLSFAATPVAIAGVALIAAGCGGGGTGGGGTGSSGAGYAAAGKPIIAAQAGTISMRHTNLGNVLVDSHGRTLYLFEKDSGMTSSCAGACASIWPPVTATGKPGAGTGLAASKIALLKRSDGTMQVSYGGHPLYTYAGDGKPGDTKGEGLNQFGAEWNVLAPNGSEIDDD
jgi:predicted lipoprotein with Yx(FWY)xxD motif